MKGLTLSSLYYEEYGRPMIHRYFRQYEDRIAVGLSGEGSECLGFDDQLSQDHDWGPSFCMWLTDEDYERIGSSLQEMYCCMPKEYKDFPQKLESEGGGGRTGVIRISDFYRKYTGLPYGPETIKEWEVIPESFLATAVSGEVFRDDLGKFSTIRKNILGFYPKDIRLRKIAARAAIMAQSGQYNFPRCLKRKEEVAGAMALCEFTEAACSIVYLLNRRYMPFYKWAHHGIQFLPVLFSIHGQLNRLYASGKVEEKQTMVEEICCCVIRELKNQGLTGGDSDFLLDHGQEVVGHIQDDEIRSRPIMMRRC